jgi:DNA-binding winged helix-turn-helix (wHTH) protein
MFTIDENISYDLTNKELFVLEKPLKLGKKLNKLLYFFITNKNKVLSKDDIQYKVWDNDPASDSSIKNLIGSLRQIVGKGKIVNLPGIGWKFVI